MARLLTLMLLAPAAVLAARAQRVPLSAAIGSDAAASATSAPPVNYNVAAGSYIELFLSALGAKGHALFESLVFDRIKVR